MHSQPGSAKETIFKNPEELKEKGIDTVNRKLAQIDQAQRMSTTLGRTVDPTNVADAKAYFDKISDKKAKPPMTTAQVRAEFASYVGNFYQHTGGLKWDPKDQAGDRVKPGTLNEMLHGNPPHPRDATGRAALDCEGTTYLTAAIFQNNPRFDVTFVQGGSHISATVFEKGSAEKGFTVNTVHAPIVEDLLVENGAQLKKLHKTVEARQNAVAGGRHGEAKPGKPNEYFGHSRQIATSRRSTPCPWSDRAFLSKSASQRFGKTPECQVVVHVVRRHGEPREQARLGGARVPQR